MQKRSWRWSWAVVVAISAVALLAVVGSAQALERPVGPGRQPTPGPYRMGPGMMHGIPSGSIYTDTLPYGYGGMMGGGMMDMMGMMDGGRMGWNFMGGVASPTLYGIAPLALVDVEAAVASYLSGLGDDDLVLGEIMIFDNHAYAEIVEASTGTGAFEVLIDPVTLAVVPEPGPNMMWNTKYGHMAGLGMMGMMGSGMMIGPGARQPGGMMGAQPEASTEMPVTSEDAIQAAQRYLSAYLPGATAAEDADAFYGYYTIHIQRGAKTVGMLSVNGYTRQVWIHTWHGDFIEMSEGHE